MSKTWCVYPFTHLATFTNGDLTPCCVGKKYNNLNLNNLTVEEAWNHAEIRNLRRKMLNGEKPLNCLDCYKEEDQGIDSHRTSSNRVFREQHGIDQSNFIDEFVDLKNLITLDLRLGNTCNLKCIMCRPNESHKWFDDIVQLNNEILPDDVKNDISYKLNYERKDYNWIKKEVFWKNIDKILPNIKEIIFGGGEPFMLKEVQMLMKEAIRIGVAKNISIRFHTNGTQLREHHYELFSSFKKIQLMFSIDGINKINYFLRYPANWDTIINTINAVDNLSINIESFILCSLNSVSAFYLDQLYDYVHLQKWNKLKIENIILGRVHYPVYLNPQTLDIIRKNQIEKKLLLTIAKYPSIKQQLEENLNWIKCDNTTSTINSTLSYINSLAKVRKIDLTILKDFLN